MINILQQGRVDDIEINDFRDLVQVFSVTSVENDPFTHRVPEIMEDGEAARILTENEYRSAEILNLIAPYIVRKVVEFEDTSLPFRFEELSEIVYCYSRARQFQQRDIFEFLSDKASKLVKLREDFKFGDAVKLSWAISRFYTNEEFPNYNADVSALIHPRDEYGKIKATKHRNINQLVHRISENNDMVEGEYIPMMLYAMSNIGYSNKEFDDGAFLTLIPFIEDQLEPIDVGYLIQAMAMNRKTEYNEFFCHAIEKTLTKLLKSFELKQELSISQILSGMVQLNIDHSKIGNFTLHIGNILDLLEKRNHNRSFIHDPITPLEHGWLQLHRPKPLQNLPNHPLTQKHHPVRRNPPKPSIQPPDPNKPNAQNHLPRPPKAMSSLLINL
jgi:hypothetical protein